MKPIKLNTENLAEKTKLLTNININGEKKTIINIPKIIPEVKINLKPIKK